MKHKFYIFLVLLTLHGFTLLAKGETDSVSVIKRDSVFTIPTNTIYADGPVDVLEEGLLPSASNDSIQRYIDLARTLIEKVRATQNYILNIDKATKVNLPVGIVNSIGGIDYNIVIEAIRLKPAYAELDIFLQFTLPNNGKELTFMARGIKFSKEGGIVGDAKLQLLGSNAINFSGDKVQLVLKGSSSPDEGTYAVMDCDGFKELSIDADIIFSRDMLVPENADGSVADGKLKTSFKTVLTGWNDLVVQVSLPAFQVNNLKGVSFAVDQAVFDFSDLRNAPAVVFPPDYQSPDFLPGNQNLWRGFYLRQLTVSLPPELKSKGTTSRKTFRGENVIIDNLGLTGKFSGSNIIPLDQGDMNGWAFSLDGVFIELQANQLIQAGFNGNIVIPVAKEDRPFEYKAIINTGGNYLFNVSPAKDMTFPLWGAGQVEIFEASYLDIRIENGKFLPKANLHGRMNIGAQLSEGGKGVEFANISFENLELQSVKPYLKVGSFSFGSEMLQQKMAGFPISISEIGLRSMSDTEVGLDFRLKLNLVGESSGSFAADAGLTLVGKIDPDKGTQSWKYKTVEVRDIAVDIDGGAFKINGKLIFYRHDAVYGDGFNGVVKAEFTPGIKVAATAIFGNVGGMRYWYADAMVNFPQGIPIFSGVGIYGFGGGAYFAMKLDNQGLGSDLGKTASGAIYIPDEKAGLGLKAIVSLGSMPSGAFDAEVTFEIAFFQGGGVRYISFGGNGSVATKGVNMNMDKMKGSVGKMVSVVKEQTSKLGAAKGLLDTGSDDNSITKIFGSIEDKAGQDGSISARMLISYDFENHILHGNFEVYVNVAGGIIAGVGPGGRAGWAVLHFAPHEWYIYAGTPDDRVGVKVGIGSISVAATSYFMVGTKILNSPPPPPEVSKILGGVDLDYMKDLNALGTGAGFAFGAALSINTGELTFLMFYSSFSAGLGFDIMLKNYGDTYCKGSNKRIGINGWYANGQSYGYFEGAIGIKVKVFGRKKKIEILSIGAATVMQAMLPNPIWMRGIVGGHFSVLGGLVKGNCKFEVTLGTKCEIEKSAADMLADIQVISEITPGQDEKGISVFNTPQAVFNMQVNKEFEIVDMESDSRRSFRIKLDHFKLVSEGKEMVGTLKWNDGQDVLAFNSYEILPSEKSVTASAQVSFEEYSNGRWATVVDGGQKVVQKMENTFVTSKAPDFIPLSNVEYSYPLIGQANFYKDEIREGYIKLKQAQPNLFGLGPEWKQKGRFTGEDGSALLFDYTYTYSTNLVSFTTPTTLKAGQTYLFELVNLPAQAAGAVDRNVSTNSNKVQSDESTSMDVEMTTRNATGTIESLQEKSIFSTGFRASQFARLQDKLLNQQVDGVLRFLRIPWYTHSMSVFLTQDEPFDKAEIMGNEYTGNKPLITLQADLTDNDYYTNHIYPLIYEGYPLDGNIKTSRDISIMGLPPVNAVSIYQNPADIELVNGTLNYTSYQILRYSYDLPMYMIEDFGDIQRQVVSRYISKPAVSDRIAKIISNTFPVLREGSYKVNVNYRLPGSTTPQYTKPMTFNLKLTN